MSDGAKGRAGGGFGWLPNWPIVIFSAVFLPITVALGCWQLERAAEKETLLALIAARQAAPPQSLATVADSGESSRYRRVWARGVFDNQHVILLQNRVRQGQPGYEVVMPFRQLDSDRWLLVNRGWLASDGDQTPPPIAPLQGTVLISGQLYRSPGKPFTVGAEQWRQQWPQVLQNLDIEALATRLGKDFLPVTMRLDAESAGAFAVGWPEVSIQPHKHRAYAVQWFAMAVALILLTVFANSNLSEWMRSLWREK